MTPKSLGNLVNFTLVYITLFNMPTTFIRTGKANLLIVTTTLTSDDGVLFNILKMQHVNDDLTVLSEEPTKQLFTEHEKFHKEIRVFAAKKKQLITSHSTDPEWNPEGYSKNLNDAIYENQQESENDQ